MKKYIHLVLIICRFYMYKFSYLLKFVISRLMPSVIMKLLINTHKGERNVSCLVVLRLCQVILCLLVSASYYKQAFFFCEYNLWGKSMVDMLGVGLSCHAVGSKFNVKESTVYITLGSLNKNVNVMVWIWNGAPEDSCVQRLQVMRLLYHQQIKALMDP